MAGIILATARRRDSARGEQEVRGASPDLRHLLGLVSHQDGDAVDAGDEQGKIARAQDRLVLAADDRLGDAAEVPLALPKPPPRPP